MLLYQLLSERAATFLSESVGTPKGEQRIYKGTKCHTHAQSVLHNRYARIIIDYVALRIIIDYVGLIIIDYVGLSERIYIYIFIYKKYVRSK